MSDSKRPGTDEEVQGLVAALAAKAQQARCTVAVAESLTGGNLSATLAAGENAGTWFRGGIVAYHPSVKFELLRVPKGPVVSARTAAMMAETAGKLLGADYSVGITGVGGPEPEERRPAGTVYLATARRGEPSIAQLHHFRGGPIDVMTQSIRVAVAALLDHMTGLFGQKAS